MTRKRLSTVGAIACGVVPGAIVVTQVGFGSDSGSEASSSPSAAGNARGQPKISAERPPSRHRGHGGKHWHNPYAGPWPAIGGGKMTKSGFLPSTIMWPDNGGWTVTSHTQTTDVEAGGDARHESDGMFSIIRTYALRSRNSQTITYVRVPGSGPVTITKAPLGRKIVVSAQNHGNIEFRVHDSPSQGRMGDPGLEPGTSSLSERRSDRLS
jgi:hypothetical protein